MIRGRGLLGFGLLVIGALTRDAAAEPEKPWPRLTPAPEWVLPHDLDVLDLTAARDPKLAPADGVSYLLVDLQHHVGVGEQFIHRASRMLTQQGVVDSDTLSIPFDPSYQTLLLHYVRLYRGQSHRDSTSQLTPDSTVINQLTESAIRLTHPETTLGSDIYPGQLCATLSLDDLRVGDVLEYAYTLRGSVPGLSGHYAERFHVQFAQAVQALHIRVLVPATTPLNQQYHQVGFRPEVITNGSLLDYRWEASGIPALIPEDCLPIAFDPFAYVDLSDFSSWGEVKDWALQLYPDLGAELSRPMRSLIAKWRAEAKTPEDRALAALRFVQENIRNTGIELGEGSYQPTRPAETLARRFGDSKDKTYLLCAFLRAMGIKAFPALVNDLERKGVAHRLPSPLAFDHAIVRMTIDDRTAWVDPTMNHQGGTLQAALIQDYGFALVLSPYANKLEPVSPCVITRPQTSTRELFTVKNFYEPVHLRVETEFLDRSAETMRADLADVGPEGVAQRRMKLYSRQFEAVRSSRAPEFIDDRSANRLTMIEEYEIEQLWDRDFTTDRCTAHFAPLGLRSVLTDPVTRLRTMPLAIPYPLYLSHHTVIELPEEWPSERQDRTVVHDAFVLADKQWILGTRIHFDYQLRTLQGEVQPDQVPSYLARLREAEASLGEKVTRPKNLPASTIDTHWGMVALAITCSVVVAACCIWLCVASRFRRRENQPTPIPLDPNSQGLGGSFLVVGGIVLMSVFRSLSTFIHGAGDWFSKATWYDLAHPRRVPFHPLFGPGLIIEMLGAIVMSGISLTACYLFLSKRRLFPKVFIATMLVTTAMMIVDRALVSLIPLAPSQRYPNTMLTILQTLTACAFWFHYMLRDPRVKSTFVW